MPYYYDFRVRVRMINYDGPFSGMLTGEDEIYRFSNVEFDTEIRCNDLVFTSFGQPNRSEVFLGRVIDISEEGDRSRVYTEFGIDQNSSLDALFLEMSK